VNFGTGGRITLESVDELPRNTHYGVPTILNALLVAAAFLAIRDSHMTARETMMYDLRPYLTIASVEVSDTLLDGRPKKCVRLVLENTGRTPAYLLETVGPDRMMCKYGVEITPAEIMRIRNLPTGTSQAAFIGSGSMWTIRCVGVTVHNDPTRGSDADESLFLAGKIAYRDVFKEIHTQVFAFRYDLAAKYWIPFRYNQED
jgi:hypothetical protein